MDLQSSLDHVCHGRQRHQQQQQQQPQAQSHLSRQHSGAIAQLTVCCDRRVTDAPRLSCTMSACGRDVVALALRGLTDGLRGETGGGTGHERGHRSRHSLAPTQPALERIDTRVRRKKTNGLR